MCEVNKEVWSPSYYDSESPRTWPALKEDWTAKHKKPWRVRGVASKLSSVINFTSNLSQVTKPSQI